MTENGEKIFFYHQCRQGRLRTCKPSKLLQESAAEPSHLLRSFEVSFAGSCKDSFAVSLFRSLPCFQTLHQILSSSSLSGESGALLQLKLSRIIHLINFYCAPRRF
jgi:hypothetical protein